MLREQATLKEDILQYVRKRKDCQERHKKRETQLQQLQKEIEEKEAELAKQEVVMALLTCLFLLTSKTRQFTNNRAVL